ncbi:MAG: hypothetical protein FWD57_04860 [Polyangiaceae bacterium]|nr:hypothetical protein [Polyangiaceae bacterium]
MNKYAIVYLSFAAAASFTAAASASEEHQPVDPNAPAQQQQQQPPQTSTGGGFSLPSPQLPNPNTSFNLPQDQFPVPGSAYGQPQQNPDGQRPSSSPQEYLRTGPDAHFVIPFGDWSKHAGVGIGASFQLQLHTIAGVAFTARSGYIFHFNKDADSITYSTAEQPNLIGVKVFFSGNEGVFVGAEGGYVRWKQMRNWDISGEKGNETVAKHRIGATLGGGWEMEPLHISLQLFVPNFPLDDTTEKVQFGLMFNIGIRARVSREGISLIPTL